MNFNDLLKAELQKLDENVEEFKKGDMVMLVPNARKIWEKLRVSEKYHRMHDFISMSRLQRWIDLESQAEVVRFSKTNRFVIVKFNGEDLPATHRGSSEMFPPELLKKV